jgi:hypothetical protein
MMLWINNLLICINEFLKIFYLKFPASNFQFSGIQTNTAIIPGKQHQKMLYGSSLESRQQFFPTVQGLDQCQLGCEHSHEVTQKILQGQPENRTNKLLVNCFREVKLGWN